MAAIKEIDANVIATILSITSDYQEKIRMHRVNFMKHYMNRRNKKKQRTFYFWCIGALGNRLSSERRFWVQASKGTGLFWEETVVMWNDDSLWLENFRMSKGTFDFICKKINAYLLREDTTFRKAIPVDKRAAICFWHLATNEDLRSLAWRFGVGKSTACEIINEVCQAVVEILLPQVIKWPSGEKLLNVIDGFLTTWGFPQCAGAIDGTHIPIVAPSESSPDYYNRKGFYSIVLQAVVDYQYRYINFPIFYRGVFNIKSIKGGEDYEFCIRLKNPQTPTPP